MTTLALFSGQPLAHAAGWSLLHFSWQGTVVAILLACILALLGGRPPQQRYAAACCALALMIALPILTFVHLATTTPKSENVVATAAIARNQAPGFRNGLTETSPWIEQIAQTLDRSVPWVLAVWLAGVILLAGRLNIGLIAAQRLKSAATQPAPVDLRMGFHDLSRRLGIVRPVALMNSALVRVPTVIGWLRPVVLIPVGCLTGLSPTQIEAILAHELAHVRRHDYLINLFQSLAETLLFYHPAVWWVSKKLRIEREHCCDDLAVKISGDSFAYAKALSFLEEHRATVPAVALGANGGALAMRIRRLLGYEQTPAVSRLAAGALMTAVVAAGGLYIGAARVQSDFAGKHAEIQSSDTSQALPAVYRGWVNEDVRWIITPAERAAFMRLTNNNERDEFISQFWERRNPPGAPANTFKREHYRRIAYSNQHFAAAGVVGWETDRGRIYIVYGPPDEIDAHPSGTTGSASPWETWQYRLIHEDGPPERENGSSGYKATMETKSDVDMKFVDVCGCGDYKLQPMLGN